MNTSSYPQKPSFHDLEAFCNTTFNNGGPFYHLSTDGNSQEIIFTCDNDFKAGMNALAFALKKHNAKIIAFAFMSNHIHWILEGDKEECLKLFHSFKAKMNRFLKSNGRPGILESFDCGDLVPITSLEQMRCEIAYVHRNPYVIQDNMLPNGYLWSDGYLYFNPIASMIGSIKFNDLTFAEKRAISMERVTEMPEDLLVYDGTVLASSISCFRYGMAFFRNASHYFSILTKSLESTGEIARRLGDGIILNDEEIYPAAVSLSVKHYNQPRIKELTASQKIELSKKLHYDYNSTNKQISRVLAIDRTVVDNLFPQSRPSMR